MRSRMFAVAGFFCVLNLLNTAARAGNQALPSSEQATAAQVDRLLAEFFEQAGVTPAPLNNDQDFLRRVSLDLTGVIPSPQAATLFGLDPHPEKRARMIDQLLESDRYARFWASYWADVIFLRATEQRARLAQPAFERWMGEQLDSNRPWTEVARELIVATGPVTEAGETALLFAHTGVPEEVAAEVSRIFLGIQMSCANCHDHPTDQWKRTQFHQLAAYFPRVQVRRETPNDNQSYAVSSLNVARPDSRRGPVGGENLENLIRTFDRNRDGLLSKAEAPPRLQRRFDQLAERLDKNKDGLLSLKELQEGGKEIKMQPGRGSAEYYMPDLQNPSSKGTLTEPAFFLTEVPSPYLSEGADDQSRRNALAEAITSPDNPWFARAFVNRIWSELVGQGFYTPIDDIGPERTPVAENVLQLLATEFTRQGSDVKWLYRTITNTQAYQRQLQAQPTDGSAVPFVAASPARLKADQVYYSLLQVLGIPENAQLIERQRKLQIGGGRAGLNPQKFAFSLLFGFDPSTPQDEIAGNIPQALYLMNSPQLQAYTKGLGDTQLGRILKAQPNNADALEEVYLLVLTRSPSSEELQINMDYLRDVGSRTAAFEDIFWSLLNSSEFLSKR
ncbi:DUF1549 domain-containing protein [Planctomicrobium sp. SH664]|uniref:DUF1549 domain-containing protein n=1 Tax=Planctomicrobium sp. SH664 TaxID=3448125 RepID=UPI003F5C2BEF